MLPARAVGLTCLLLLFAGLSWGVEVEWPADEPLENKLKLQVWVYQSVTSPLEDYPNEFQQVEITFGTFTVCEPSTATGAMECKERTGKTLATEMQMQSVGCCNRRYDATKLYEQEFVEVVDGTLFTVGIARGLWVDGHRYRTATAAVSWSPEYTQKQVYKTVQMPGPAGATPYWQDTFITLGWQIVSLAPHIPVNIPISSALTEETKEDLKVVADVAMCLADKAAASGKMSDILDYHWWLDRLTLECATTRTLGPLLDRRRRLGSNTEHRFFTLEVGTGATASFVSAAAMLGFAWDLDEEDHPVDVYVKICPGVSTIPDSIRAFIRVGLATMAKGGSWGWAVVGNAGGAPLKNVNLPTKVASIAGLLGANIAVQIVGSATKSVSLEFAVGVAINPGKITNIPLKFGLHVCFSFRQIKSLWDGLKTFLRSITGGLLRNEALPEHNETTTTAVPSPPAWPWAGDFPGDCLNVAFEVDAYAGELLWALARQPAEGFSTTLASGRGDRGQLWFPVSSNNDSCVAVGADDCFALLIADEYGDGMCCEHGEGGVTVGFGATGGTVWLSGNWSDGAVFFLQDGSVVDECVIPSTVDVIPPAVDVVSHNRTTSSPWSQEQPSEEVHDGGAPRVDLWVVKGLSPAIVLALPNFFAW